MEAQRSDEYEPDEKLYPVLLDFLESAERGVGPDRAALLARHPELAPGLEEFFDTWVRVEGLTEPIRSASRALRAAAPASQEQGSAGAGQRGRVAPSDEPGDLGNHNLTPGAPPGAAGGEEGGWLGRWLRRHPPLAAEHYPFLNAAQPREEIGRLGPYRLLEVIGSGGMGVVFRAEDEALRRTVAVKVLRAELAADPNSRRRFLREVRAAAALDHENVVAVYQVGEEGGVPFLVMQWLRGMSLDELLRRTGRLEVPAVLRLGRQIALGLAAAHGRGLLHRDIKPANLWVEWPEAASGGSDAGPETVAAARVKILDFGLACAADGKGHLTASGAAVGTPAYMAPEQAAGGAVDARCDLFGLGVVLYRMCTGRLPFPGRREAAAGGPSGVKPPSASALNPAVPPGLSDLVMELLAPDPADRPASAAEVAGRIQSLQAGGATPAVPVGTVTMTPAPATPRPVGGRTRRWIPVTVVALAALVPLAYAFGGVVVRFCTNRGEVVIVVDDPTTEVTVREGGAVIEDPKGQRRITLAAGEHELEVTVRDAAGETRFFTKSFALSRGGKEVINVREEVPTTLPRKPSASDHGPEASANGSVMRRAAEWVFSEKGKLKVLGVNGERVVQSATDLPAGEFQVVSVDLSRSDVTDAGLAHLEPLSDLRALDLAYAPIDDAGLTHIAALKNLQRLNVNNTNAGDAGLSRLGRLTALQELRLAGTKVTDAGLANLQTLTNLQTLELSSTAVGDAGMANVAALIALRDLNLKGTRVGDAGLVHFKSLQELRVVNLTNTRVTDAGLTHLRPLARLQRLDLAGTRVTDAGMPEVKEISGLLSIDLTQTRVGDAALESLAALEKLQSISLHRTGVTDAGLARLAGLKDLTSLGLGGTGVTDVGVAHLADRTRLEYLDLTRTHITDAGMAHISGMTALRYLLLGDTRVTDAGLRHLAGMKRLRRLHLNGTRVTDAGLMPVLSLPLPPLEFLDLSGARVSASGASAVRDVLPNARVDWWEPNRRAAESVLAAGGSVHVRTGVPGSDIPVKDPANLPGDYFRLTRARVKGVRNLPREVLPHVASLTDAEFDDFQELDLRDSGVSDADLETLGALPCRRLVLDRCPVVGPGLLHLKNLPRLTELSLDCPTLSAFGIQYVGGLKRLERLSLSGSGANDASLKGLYELANLRELVLTGTKVTAGGVAALKTALPMCEVKATAGRQ